MRYNPSQSIGVAGLPELLTSLAILAGGTESLGSGVHGLVCSFTDGPDLAWALRNDAEWGRGVSGTFWKW